MHFDFPQFVLLTTLIIAMDRAQFPLAQAPTPHILRKYTYQNEDGIQCEFEESATPVLADRARKRQHPPYPSEPSPKRYAMDTTEVMQSDELALPSPRSPPVLSAPTDNTASRIARVIDAFEDLPLGAHRYALFQLCRECDRSTLSTLVSLVTTALRRDILSALPYRLAETVLGLLDYKSLCAMAQVSKRWYSLVENNERIWKNLLDRDMLTPSDIDFARARREKWGYTGWTTESDEVVDSEPSNAMGKPVNLYKAIYRRKLLISKNWMNPNAQPTRQSIGCADSDVITCLEFDEDRIIAGSDRKYITVYDTQTGQKLHHFDDHTGGVWALKYVNKDTIVSGSTDRTVRVWSISKDRCTHVFRGHSSTVRCLDIVKPVAKYDDHGRKVMVPPHPLIITGSRDATLRMWRLPDADDPDFESENVDDTGPFFIRTLQGHSAPVRAIDCYADTVVSGSYDHSVRVWNISTSECRWELRGHNQQVYAAVIDPKRNRCISASMDWNVKVWCLETGTLLHNLEGHSSLVGLLDLNRTTLVSAAADSTLRVWDPETGALLHRLEGHEGAITCFQHDETRLVSGSGKTLKLWNIKTGGLVGDLFRNLDLTNIWQVRFDSRRCVSAVNRGEKSYLEILDFDYDPTANRIEELSE